MNHLIVVSVCGEEQSTATAVIESDYKAANLISISLVESSNFLCLLYYTKRQNFLQIVDTAKENELYLQCHAYGKIQCSVSSFKPRYPTAKPKNYQQNVTVGGGLISIIESFRNGPELTNRQNQLSFVVFLHLLLSISGHVKFM